MSIKFLDCTIRDGSYAINFNYSCEEIKSIIKGLDEAGVDFIEIGHGVGIGYWRKGFNLMPCSQDDQALIASKFIKKAKWGMFAIPGICQLSEIKKFADMGMKFIRIGFEAQKIKTAIPYIEMAKKTNMIVAVNFMKSYTESTKKIASIANELWKYGVDYIYIVDSAGGMLPEELKEYIHEIKNKNPDIKLGFHGHNNLGLAVFNSYLAVKEGVELIDVSIMGIGRGAGNTCFEQLVAVLIKAGYDVKVDLMKIMEISEKYISKYMKLLYTTPLDVISGLALFHSSYMPFIKEAAKKFKVDPKYLIMETSKTEKIDVTQEIVFEAAKRLKKLGKEGDWYKFYKNYYGLEQ